MSVSGSTSKSEKDDLWNWFVSDWRRLVITGVLVTIAASIAVVPYGILPIRELIASRSWPARDAKVRRSRVMVSHGGRSYSYRVDVEYEYFAAGERRVSDRYGFAPMKSSNDEAIKAIVAAHPSGSITPCYVNPGNPNRAVLNRDFDPVVAYQAWIPAGALLVVGICLLLTGEFVRRAPGEKWTAQQFLLLAVCLPIGGCFSILLWQSVGEMMAGHPDWFLLSFSAGLTLALLCVTAAVVYGLPRRTR